MATLEKIRNKAGLLVIVVGIALFAFIIGDFLNSGSTYFRQSQEKIAEINGTSINIQDYQMRIDEMSEIYKMQTGSTNLPEEMSTQLRQSVFDGMVQEIVISEAMEKIGMEVSPEELFDMVQGENISPMLQQNQMFHNPQTGAFDKTQLLNFLKAIDDDNIANYPPEQQAELLRYRNYWLFMEKNIKLQRMEQKYATLLGKAIVANTIDAKASFDESAVSANISYTMQSYSTIPDSTITVSKGELEKLYDQRKETYKQRESKVIKYIAVDIKPSEEDYAKAQSDIDALKNELATTTQVAELVNENSEIPYEDAFIGENEMTPEMKQFVANADVDDIYGPVFENDQYKMFKLMDKTIAPDSVKVSHIMLPDTGTENKLVDSLMTVLNSGGNFAEIAGQYSMDQNAAQNGGEIGWLTERAAIRSLNKEFKDAIFSADLNKIFQFKSMYGIQLIKVTEKTSNVTKYKVADIQTTLSPSSKTYSNIYNELNQFISKNQNMDKMDEAAKEAGYNLISNVTVTAADQNVGSVKNSRQVIRWAFQNKKGSISEIFEADDKFIVAAVQGTIPEGYRSLSSVEPTLKAEIIAQKKGDQIVKDLKEKNLTSLDAYAQAMGGSIDSVKFVSFNTPRITGIGAEPKLNAMISLTDVGQLSSPVSGNNGVYVFQVYEKNQDQKEFNEAEQIRGIEASNAYRFGYMAIQSMINDAKIEDNRIRFY